jgi:hypothetical protein
MPFIAKLKVDGEEMNILQCAFRFTQSTDNTGKPTAVPQGGAVTLVIESNGSTNLFDWMVSPTQTKSGTITFFRRDNLSKLKTLSFSDAHCVDYYETFDHSSDSPMQVQLTLSAKEVKLNESQFKNNWPE